MFALTMLVGASTAWRQGGSSERPRRGPLSPETGTAHPPSATSSRTCADPAPRVGPGGA